MKKVISNGSSLHLGLILITMGCLFLFYFIGSIADDIPFVKSSWFSLLLAILLIMITVLMLGFFAKNVSKKGKYNYQIPGSFDVKFNWKIPGKNYAYFIVSSVAVLGGDYGLYVLTREPETIIPFLGAAAAAIYGLAFVFRLAEINLTKL